MEKLSYNFLIFSLILLKGFIFKCRISVKYSISYKDVYRRIMMNKLKGLSFVFLAVVIFSMSVLTGCGEEKSGNTINEPEITVDYLRTDYAQQLTTDGAEIMLGTVELNKNEDSYNVTITEKEVVPSSSYDEGYYIADTNVTKEATLGSDARMTCQVDVKEQVIKAGDFIKNHENNPEQLYTVYLMGDSAELILATEPKDVITE